MTDWQTPHKRILMFGAAGKWIDGSAIAPQLRFQWKGFFPAIDDATRNSWFLRHKLHNVVAEIPCIACHGGRLRQEAAAVRLGKKTIVEVCDVPLAEAARFFDKLKLGATQRRVAGSACETPPPAGTVGVVAMQQLEITSGGAYVTAARVPSGV